MLGKPNPAKGIDLSHDTFGVAVAIRTIWGEANTEDDEGQQAVAHVILNRFLSGLFGPSLAYVCLSHNQFDCWFNTLPNFRHISTLKDNNPQLIRCEKNFYNAQVAVLDETEGALYYYSPIIPFPSSFKNFTYIATFGTQKFYK